LTFPSCAHPHISLKHFDWFVRAYSRVSAFFRHDIHPIYYIMVQTSFAFLLVLAVLFTASPSIANSEHVNEQKDVVTTTRAPAEYVPFFSDLSHSLISHGCSGWALRLSSIVGIPQRRLTLLLPRRMRLTMIITH
jgi:hypothetical protein